MKISLFSNYLTCHQLPFCQAMLHTEGIEFSFIATRCFSPQEVTAGFSDMNQLPFVLRAYENDEQMRQAQQLAMESDVAIFGSAPEALLRPRVLAGKLTFRYSERILGKGKWHAFTPRSARNLLHNHRAYIRKPLYLLCASAYSAADYGVWGAYRNKTYKWGYFPPVYHYDPAQLYAQKNTSSILWCGRLLDWKCPDLALAVAKRLKNEGYKFTLNLIGSGEEAETLAAEIEHSGLNDCVYLLGSMAPEDVRSHMEKAGIFLFTSNFREGWGAVLNEAMNSGCAVVASHAPGSVPFLLQDGKNGLIYQNSTCNELYERVKYLLDYPEKQAELGRCAYNTITEVWNAEVAAKRLLLLAGQLQATGQCDLFADGPCSRAKRLSNHWWEKARQKT